MILETDYEEFLKMCYFWKKTDPDKKKDIKYHPALIFELYVKQSDYHVVTVYYHLCMLQSGNISATLLNCHTIHLFLSLLDHHNIFQGPRYMAQLIPEAAAQCEGWNKEVEVGLNRVTEGDLRKCHFLDGSPRMCMVHTENF